MYSKKIDRNWLWGIFTVLGLMSSLVSRDAVASCLADQNVAIAGAYLQYLSEYQSQAHPGSSASAVRNRVTGQTSATFGNGAFNASMNALAANGGCWAQYVYGNYFYSIYH